MKILMIHNSYLTPGGEDAAVDSEIKMLRHFGHTVIPYNRGNEEISKMPVLKKIDLCLKDSLYSRKTYSDITGIINEHSPDIAHFHNPFLLITPSAYDACFKKNIPMVQTLHNYRFLCPNGVFFRDGDVCEDCQIFSKNSAVINKCWHDSYLYSLFMARAVYEYHKMEILSKKIGRFIALSGFSMEKFVEFGFNKEKITVKPNFVEIEDKSEAPICDEGLFVGYLEEYKGIRTLIEAYKKSKYKLKIIGDGPLFNEVSDIAGTSENITLLGRLSSKDTESEIRRARYVVYPSCCYETFGRVIIEAFSCRKPVIVSDAGAPAELVDNGKTGFIFKSGNHNDLLDKVKMLTENKELASRMGINARAVYEEKFTMQKNYDILMDIYNKVL